MPEGGVETKQFVSEIYYSSPGGIESLSVSLSLLRTPSTYPPMTAAAALPCFACLSSCSISQEKFAHPQSRSRGREHGSLLSRGGGEVLQP